MPIIVILIFIHVQLVGKFTRSKGRPPKKGLPDKKNVSGCSESGDACMAKSTGTQTNDTITTEGINFNSCGLLDLTEWRLEETCFGDLLRGPCGDTLLPAGLFEEVTENMKQLSKRKSFILSVYNASAFSTIFITSLLSPFRVRHEKRNPTIKGKDAPGVQHKQKPSNLRTSRVRKPSPFLVQY